MLVDKTYLWTCFDRLQISYYHLGKLSQLELINSMKTWAQHSATSKKKKKKENQINREDERRERMEHKI